MFSTPQTQLSDLEFISTNCREKENNRKGEAKDKVSLVFIDQGLGGFGSTSLNLAMNGYICFEGEKTNSI